MDDDHLLEWKEASEALGTLAKDERDFASAVAAFDTGDAASFRKVLEKHQLLGHLTRICFWLCTWRCVRVVRVVCHDLPVAAPTPDEFREFSQLVHPLGENRDLVKRLVDSLDRGDANGFGAVVKELKLQRFCFFLAQWICYFRCQRFCLLIAAGPALDRPGDPLEDLRESFEGLARLGRDASAFTTALQAFEKPDVAKFRGALEHAFVLRYCQIICRWFCHWHCFRLCFILCRELPKIDLTIPQLREFALALGHVARDADALKQVSGVLLKGDARAWGPLLERLELSRFCYYLCRWYCHLHCQRHCHIFCPPGCLSVFRYIGGYNLLTGINSAGNGLTTADTRAFFSTIRLNGVLCKQHSGGPAEYRFEFRAPGSAVWTPVPTAMIARTVIGQWQAPPLVSGDPIQVKPYTVKGAAPNDMVASITPDGWIQVPQESNVSLPTGNFAPNGNLIELDTTKLQAWPVIDLAGIVAGHSTNPPALGLDAVYGLRLLVRRAGMPGTATVSGTCDHVAIYNRHYDHVRHKGSWAPQDDDDQLGAALVNIDEIGTGCGKIANALTIKYTAAHPNLGAVSIHMDGPGGPYATTLADAAGSTPANRFGTATLVLPAGKTVADLKKCAYIVKLSVTTLLTTGDGVPDPIGDEVAFCK